MKNKHAVAALAVLVTFGLFAITLAALYTSGAGPAATLVVEGQ